MFGCSLDEAFGKKKLKKDVNVVHANKISKSQFLNNDIDDRMKNRIDEKLIISNTLDLKENKQIDNKINEELLIKLNNVLSRLDNLENNMKEKKTIIQSEPKSEPKSEPRSEPGLDNSQSSTGFSKILQQFKKSNSLIENFKNNSNFNNSINQPLMGYQNKNISYIGDQMNELLLFGLMGLFILLLFDYIYKLGKKTY